MGIFIPSKQRTNRRFSYEPRYYNPEKEQKLRQRMQIQRRSLSKRRDKTGLLYFLMLLGLAFFVYMKIG